MKVCFSVGLDLFCVITDFECFAESGGEIGGDLTWQIPRRDKVGAVLNSGTFLVLSPGPLAPLSSTLSTWPHPLPVYNPGVQNGIRHRILQANFILTSVRSIVYSNL